MWEITNPTIQRAKLDFTSSGQGFREVSQLAAGKIVLMNALELMDFADDRIQVLICEHCGTIHCEPGGWVNLRSSSGFILMIPAFDEVEDDWSRTEYAPPRYFYKNGTPFFSSETYRQLQKQNPHFPKIENIKSLQAREAMRLAQLYMPVQLFGEPPEIKLNLEQAQRFVASSRGEASDRIKEIEEILVRNYENKSPVQLRRAGSSDEIISLFSDDFEFAEWKVLVEDGSEKKLFLEETFVVDCT